MTCATRQSGFSLLELLVASTIFFMFIVGISSVYSRTHVIYTRGQNRVEVQQSARIALLTLMREIRSAGFDPSGLVPQQATAAPVQAAESDRLVLLADVDGDGSTDRVTYRLDGRRLVRDVESWDGEEFLPPTSGELAEEVEQLSFGYSSGGAELPAPVAPDDLGSIHRVRIDLVTTHSAIGEQERYPLHVDVGLRNQP
jgi:type II secretory pathway component PulJ